MQVLIALLRGINVGGHKKVPMAELRAIAASLGAAHVETYIQSGNLVCASSMTATAFETALATALDAHFGFSVDVIVRTASRWTAYAAGSPFPDAASARPHLLHLAVSKQPPSVDAAAAIQAKGTAGERVAQLSDGLWIDFAGGAGTSKLTPVLLNRLVGSSVTARNWNTVLQLDEMATRVGAAIPSIRG